MLRCLVPLMSCFDSLVSHACCPRSSAAGSPPWTFKAAWPQRVRALVPHTVLMHRQEPHSWYRGVSDDDGTLTVWPMHVMHGREMRM